MHHVADFRGPSAGILLALVLAGCSGFGKKDEPSPVTDPNVFPANYKADVAAFLRTYLNNPTKVRDAAITVPALKPVAGSTHYVSCVRYNPRDEQNRYTGLEGRMAIFWNGRLNQFLPANPDLCTNAVYQRFPEAESLVP